MRECGGRLDRVRRCRTSLKGGGEVRERVVVRLEGLKAADVYTLVAVLEDDRRRGVSDRTVGGRMPVLGMDRRAFGRSRQRLVGLVERHDLRVVDRRHDGIRIETFYPRER